MSQTNVEQNAANRNDVTYDQALTELAAVMRLRSQAVDGDNPMNNWADRIEVAVVHDSGSLLAGIAQEIRRFEQALMSKAATHDRASAMRRWEILNEMNNWAELIESAIE
jgi:hypothetical protein